MTASGSPDSAFAISEPVDESAQTPDPDNGNVELPELRLPSITYLALTIYLCTLPVIPLLQARRGFPDDGQVPTMKFWEIVYLFILGCTIVMPVLFEMRKVIHVHDLMWRGRKCSGYKTPLGYAFEIKSIT